MKIVLSEFINQYQTYSFGYCLYAAPEQASEIPDVYQQGFLPYSADNTLAASVFYLARSLKVDVHEFSDTSENRRVDRKIAPFNIKMEVHDRQSFLLTPEVLEFCNAYTDERFAHQAMPETRLNYVLNHALGNCFVTFHLKEKLIGLVYGVTYADMFHYWFSFYDTEFLGQAPIGKWMMWKTIHWAQETGKKSVYLGTCYGPSALYKVRDFKGLAFFDGLGWNKDLQDLKTRCYGDETVPAKDYLKAHQVMDQIFKPFTSSH